MNQTHTTPEAIPAHRRYNHLIPIANRALGIVARGTWRGMRLLLKVAFSLPRLFSTKRQMEEKTPGRGTRV